MKSFLFALFLVFSFFNLHAQDPSIEWQRTIGGSGSDQLTSVINTSDGGYLIGGRSDSVISGEKTENSRGGEDYWVLKLNAQGTIEWQRTIGGDQDDLLQSIKQTLDGGYILGGTSLSGISGEKTEESRGGNDYWIIKLNSGGDIQWQKTYGGNDQDNLSSIIQTTGGGFILAGLSRSGISGDRTATLLGDRDIWIIKLDENGDIEWQRARDLYEAYAGVRIRQTQDGGYVIGGTRASISVYDAYCVIKLNSIGNEIWRKYFQGNGNDWSTNIIQTSDNGYMVIGFSDSDISGDKTEPTNGHWDFWILKLDAAGEIQWQKSIGGSSAEAPYSVIESLEGGYFISGYSYSNISGDKTEDSRGFGDYWIIKINDVGIIEWQNTIGGSGHERIPFAVQNNNGDYLIAGSSGSDISGEKSENSRGGFDYWIVKHFQTLSIDENSFYNQLSIFPNPTQNKLSIDSKDQIINTVNVYSLNGSLIQEYKTDTTSPSIDVSALASGVYYIQFYSGNKVALKKFIKE